MGHANVVICGLARNIDHILDVNMLRVEELGMYFNDYQVVVYENDSSYLTPDMLKNWADINHRVHVITEQCDDPVNPGIRCLDRATRMAKYRNELRSQVVNKGLTVWANYIIVIDLDLLGGWSYDGVASTFGVKDAAWDFVGSNGLLIRDYKGKPDIRVHFDVWAFRYQGSDRPQRPEEINPKQWLRGMDLVPVNSCFGGMGIYRSEAFDRCSYDGSDCEHVPFHRKMREAGMGRLFMNPSQITLYSHPIL